jgi:hypothetical protein
MGLGKYTIYPGQFVCHTCKVEVRTLRSYPADKILTWMCPEKHLSQVDLSKKKAKDFE